jgi:toxin-antitoxin system PIN domain toxin
MILWDVNLWVYAFRADSPFQEAAREELEGSSHAGNSFLFSPHVAASFLRLVTNSRIFAHPSPLEEAWNFVDVLEAREHAVKVDVDPMTFGIFKHLSLVSRASGNEIPDALLASMAIRHDATLVTADRRFEHYDGLPLRMLDR